MKRMWVKLLLGVVFLVIVAAVLVFVFLDRIVKRSVETVGPAITKVDVSLDGAKLSPFSGSGELTGLTVGNPPGFKTASAMKVGSVAMSIEPASVFADKAVIRSVKVLNPEITLEGDLSGNNLSKILENVRGTANTNQPTTKEEKKATTRKLQVDDFLISGGKVHFSTAMLGGQSASVSLPEIHLTKLGQGTDGITPAELTEKITAEILAAATKAVAANVTDLGKNVGGILEKAGTNANVEKVTRGIGDLLRRK